MQEKELDPLKDLARALGEQADLPTRTNTGRRPKGGKVSCGPVIAAGYDWEPMPGGGELNGVEDQDDVHGGAD